MFRNSKLDPPGNTPYGILRESHLNSDRVEEPRLAALYHYGGIERKVA